MIGHHGGFGERREPGPGRRQHVHGAASAGGATSETRSRGARRPSGSRAATALPDGLTVLLVDDESDAREALRLILQQNGMVVTTAASAREAFASVERLQPDVLLSDIAMPGEDGLSLIRRVRLLPPGGGGRIPAAALSAYAGAADRRSGRCWPGSRTTSRKPVGSGPPARRDREADRARRRRRAVLGHGRP